MKETYQPNPINTEDIQLPEELLELTEKIAENVHEIWAKGRIADGWTYGEKRDDVLKTTPCLVPYDELSEVEKEYDRNTAMETLKMIVALGYEVYYNQSEQHAGDFPERLKSAIAECSESCCERLVKEANN